MFFSTTKKLGMAVEISRRFPQNAAIAKLIREMVMENLKNGHGKVMKSILSIRQTQNVIISASQTRLLYFSYEVFLGL